MIVDCALDHTFLRKDGQHFVRTRSDGCMEYLAKDCADSFILSLTWASSTRAWLASCSWRDRTSVDVNDIGLLSTAAMKRLHGWLFCQKKSVRKFSDEFSKYVLQQDEFSKCIFHLGPVFFRTTFPYTTFPCRLENSKSRVHMPPTIWPAEFITF